MSNGKNSKFFEVSILTGCELYKQRVGRAYRISSSQVPHLFGSPIAKKDSYKTIAERAFENGLEMPIEDRSHVEHLKSFYKGLINPALGLPYQEKTQKEKTMKHEEIKIKITNNGYYVQVGCQSFVFADHVSLIAAIEDYRDDPEAAQKKYCRE